MLEFGPPGPLNMYLEALAAIGSITAAVTAVRFLRFLYLYNRPSSIDRYILPNAWALVTGSSDGIGLAFARELATKGLNIVLHGRNAEKLEKVMASLSKAFPAISVRILVVDATNAHGMKKGIEGMVVELANLPGPLTILINNVGGTPFIHETFRSMQDFSPQDVDDMINLNVRFTMHLTRSLLPVLQRTAPSLVINVGSIAGCSGIPFVSAYSGAKAFNIMWSVAMTRELSILNTHVECIGLIVGTVTETSGMRSTPSSLALPNATTVARSALQKVGCGRPLVAAYWGHAVVLFITQSMPEPLGSIFIQRRIEDFRREQWIKREDKQE